MTHLYFHFKYNFIILKRKTLIQNFFLFINFYLIINSFQCTKNYYLFLFLFFLIQSSLDYFKLFNSFDHEDQINYFYFKFNSIFHHFMLILLEWKSKILFSLLNFIVIKRSLPKLLTIFLHLTSLYRFHYLLHPLYFILH
jgi:hypothetical protein